MTISYSRPEPPLPISAEDALVEAVYWLHFGDSPEKALPWLTYAGRHGKTKEDFDEIAKYGAQVQGRAPEKWRAYQRGALKIPMQYHPRSLALLERERAQRHSAGGAVSVKDAALKAKVKALVGGGRKS